MAHARISNVLCITAGLLNRFHGVMKTEATAAIIPPVRQLMWLGATLEKSKAGDTKLATMLMPIVAMVNVIAPITIAKGESILPTVSTGSVIKCPKAGKVAEVVITVTTEKDVRRVVPCSRRPRKRGNAP